MNAEQAQQRIAALTAIVQTMMRETYCGTGGENGRALFELQLEDDELLAMAIRNVFGEALLTETFSASAAGAGAAGEEVAASSLAPHLTPKQRQAARVALLGHREADDAHTLAVRAPQTPGSPELSADDRVRFAEEAFLGRMEIDVLHEREGWSGFATRAKANTEQRIAQLPEPWRKHARTRLPELRARIRETLERTRAQPA